MSFDPMNQPCASCGLGALHYSLKECVHDLRAERDQLRAEIERLKKAITKIAALTRLAELTLGQRQHDEEKKP